jgi:hypothetical protein
MRRDTSRPCTSSAVSRAFLSQISTPGVSRLTLYQAFVAAAADGQQPAVQQQSQVSGLFPTAC